MTIIANLISFTNKEISCKTVKIDLETGDKTNSQKLRLSS